VSEGLTLSGDLSEIHLPQLLMSLYRERETGILRVDDGPYRKSLFIRDGDVVFAASTDPDERLGECLLRRGVITVGQYVESARLIGPGHRQGEILVDLGAITPDDLVEGVSQQLYDIIFSLIPCTGGSYDLSLDEFSAEDLITLNVSLPVLLLRGMERVRRWSLIYPAVGDPDTRLKRAGVLPPFYQQLELTPEQEHVLTLCGEGLPVSALLEASYLNPFETYRVLWIGVTLGLLERQSEGARGTTGAAWNAEPVIEHYNDLFAFLHRALREKASEAGADALAIAGPAHATLSEGQGDLATCGRLDVDRLLAALRAIPEESRPTALKAFLDEVLYAFSFVAESRMSAQDTAAFRDYMKTHGTPA